MDEKEDLEIGDDEKEKLLDEKSNVE